MISQDELQQLPVQGPFLKANILWETRITTVPATISMAHARDAEAESKVWRLLSFLLTSLAGAAGGTLYSLTDQMRHVGSTEKLLADFISLLF